MKVRMSVHRPVTGVYGNALQAAVGPGGNLDIVKFLVENGANVNAHGGDCGNALQTAICWGKVDIMKFLVENGANVNACGGEHGNALQAAVYLGRADIVKYLVEQGPGEYYNCESVE
ncbi:hypothetical protein HHX47_DHR1001693 [Lentinula edodes]|nr:hypothetical protein HHX47_DHR1001693 [Lentinula edodes]